ncbi:MAG: PIN domain-containing protein [Dehalococcoidia bacterium]
MKFLDTNIFLRYLVRDDPAKARATRALFQQIWRGAEIGATSEAVVAEIVYVLSSPRWYRFTHADISARLRPLIALRGVRISHKRTGLHVLTVYAAHPFLDFEDALTVAHMKRLGITEVLSYDSDFDRVDGAQRIES